MASLRNQRKAQIQEAINRAGAAYKQGEYDKALEILQPFLSDETVQRAIAKILAAKQNTINLKPKRDVEEISEAEETEPSPKAKTTIQYILVTLLFCGSCFFLMSLGGNSGSNTTNNSAIPAQVSSYAEDYYTNFDGVIVRTCATFTCESLVELPVGTRVSFIEALEGEASPVDGTTVWYHVRLSDNREGFINSRVLSEIRPTPAPTPIPPPVSRPSNNSSSGSQRSWDCSGDVYNCDDFSTCSDVSSYLNTCPSDQSRLDADNDGIGCDNMCQ